MERNKENFYKLTDKQREKIKEFNEKIAEHIAILEEYE
jgi:DNA-binding PadR family transcriptional regulator